MNVTIPGDPVAKERPRRGQYGNFYTPRATAEYEKLVASYCQAQEVRFLSGSKLVVRLDFYLKPRDHKRLDLDNLIKSALDGVQASGCVPNDNQVVAIASRKLVEATNPRTVITVRVIA